LGASAARLCGVPNASWHRLEASHQEFARIRFKKFSKAKDGQRQILHNLAVAPQRSNRKPDTSGKERPSAKVFRIAAIKL
jgi:hypothetical protein